MRYPVDDLKHGAKEGGLMSCRACRELEHDKQYVDELVEKYAPGSQEFEHWIAESAELSSRLDIHKAYCVFCRAGL
jgi:hypothetical protein